MGDSLLRERVSHTLAARPEDRDQEELRMIVGWLKELSRAEAKKGKVCVLGELADGALHELVKFSLLETRCAGSLLIRQGSPGDFMFILLTGECDVRVSSSAEPGVAEGDVVSGGSKEFGEALGVLVGVVGPGSVIGEVALVRQVYRTANVIVSANCDECVAIRISRDLYQRTLASHLDSLEREREEFASGFHLVSSLNPRLRQQFIRALMKEKYYNGDIIVRQGDKIEDVFFIVSGEVLLYLSPSRLAQQYELHLQAKNVYSILPTKEKRRTAGGARRAAAASRRDGARQQRVVWSCVSNNAMLGDFEVFAQLPSRMATAVAQTETVLFRMNLPEFRRLVLKEGKETVRTARQLAKASLQYRNGKRREKLTPKEAAASEVAFVDYVIRAIDQLAAPT